MLTEYRLSIDGRDVSAVVVASSYLGRLRGLLGTSSDALPLLLSPANSVHGWGMRYPLDVAQLSGAPPSGLFAERVVTLRPWGFVGPRRRVGHVLEAPRGTFATWGLEPGSRVALLS
jgi:uncharacterized protein